MRTQVLEVATEQSELVEGFSAAEPQPPAIAGVLVLEDGNEVSMGGALLEIFNLLLAEGLTGRRATLSISSAVISPEAAAKKLGVSRPTVYAMLDAGELPWLRVGTHRRIAARDVDDLLLAAFNRDETAKVLEDTSLTQPLADDDYRRALMETRKTGDPGATKEVRRAQRAARARAAATRATAKA
jgi:excisionase family DNA binding protein